MKTPLIPAEPDALLARPRPARRGRPAGKGSDRHLRLDIAAYLPSDYIADGVFRVELHDRLGRALRLERTRGARWIRDEIEDRFGKLPQPVENLTVECIHTYAMSHFDVCDVAFWVLLRLTQDPLPSPSRCGQVKL
jgi:hypothetical protein